MRPQIAANLRAFMQLALTQDAGRYPTLAGFIRELASLIDDTDAAPGEGLAADGENAVRLLTIHGSKGLEAPIVWLLGGSDHARGDSYARAGAVAADGGAARAFFAVRQAGRARRLARTLV